MALKLDQLNPHQREAVLHYQGPLLILAGAGSGKTSTMAYRIAHLMTEKHLPAESILGLSFTNKAAKELRERVTKLVLSQSSRSPSRFSSRQAIRGLTITTFHSLCVRILKAFGDKIGFQKSFTICDDSDQLSTLKQVLKNIKIDERRFDPDVIRFEIGQAKNRFLNAEQAEEYFLNSGRMTPDYALATAAAFPRYQEKLKLLNAMDFDDLIYYTVQLLDQHADVREHFNFRFRHILVDEYQDTNAAQFRILKLLTEKQQNLCVVGDDDQSIYAWRGADPAHILEFSRIYPQAKVIALEQNYRSTSRILEAANQVIQKNKNRYPKELWSERGAGEPLVEVVVEEDRAEAEFVSEEILKRNREQQKLWKDFAILYRSNAQSRIFEEALRRKGVPYKIVGGLSFLARKEVKDVLSYWRLIVNPQDDASLRRIVNWPARGIGKTSIETIGNHTFEQTVSFFEAMKLAPKLAPKSAEAISRFRSLILGLRQELLQTPPTPEAVAHWARRSLDRIEVKRGLEEDTDDPAQLARRWENVEELIHSIGQTQKGDPLPDPVATTDSPGNAPSSVPPAALDSVETSPALGIEAALGIGMGTPVEMPSPEMNELKRMADAEFGGSSSEEGASQGASGQEFLRDFLHKMTLEAQDVERDEERKKDDPERDQVTLLTLHGAKGLEYPIVFLVGMEEGYLPHKRTLDEVTDLSEERRLCYVGITRARDFLFLVRAKNRVRYGKPVPRSPSRFLADIPKDLIVRVDESLTPEYTSPAAQETHENKVKDFLSQIRANLMK